jgi:nitrate/nitrite transporter NarK
MPRDDTPAAHASTAAGDRPVPRRVPHREIADLTAGSSNTNLAQGVAASAWGVGAAVSNTLAGYAADGFGYDAAFLLLAAIAAGALVLFWTMVPETRDWPAPAPAMATGRRALAAGQAGLG